MNGPAIYASKNIIGPPGIPDGVVAALRKALSDAMADKEFAASMEKFTGIQNNFFEGATAQKQLTEVTQAFLDKKDTIDDLQQMVYDKFVK